MLLGGVRVFVRGAHARSVCLSPARRAAAVSGVRRTRVRSDWRLRAFRLAYAHCAAPVASRAVSPRGARSAPIAPLGAMWLHVRILECGEVCVSDLPP